MSDALTWTYRRKAGDPVICRQFFARDVLSFPMVQRDDQSATFYLIDSKIEAQSVTDGDWILPDDDGTHFTVISDGAFHQTYEMVDAYKRRVVQTGDIDNPSESVSDDPDDSQAKLGQRAR